MTEKRIRYSLFMIQRNISSWETESISIFGLLQDLMNQQTFNSLPLCAYTFLDTMLTMICNASHYVLCKCSRALWHPRTTMVCFPQRFLPMSLCTLNTCSRGKAISKLCSFIVMTITPSRHGFVAASSAIFEVSTLHNVAFQKRERQFVWHYDVFFI